MVVDLYPGEQDEVIAALVWAMRDIGPEMKERFNFYLFLPLDVDAEIGLNWLDTEPTSVVVS